MRAADEELLSVRASADRLQEAVMDGYEATEKIVKMIREKEIAPMTVFGVTAYTSTEHLDSCINSGIKCTSILLNSLQISEI